MRAGETRNSLNACYYKYDYKYDQGLCGSYYTRDCILSSTWFLLYAVFYIIHCYVHVMMYTLNALYFPSNGG